MKPRIWLENGEWRCMASSGIRYFVGVGASPSEAYVLWHKAEMAARR